MSIYTYSVNYVVENLLPPILRQVKQIAWLKVIAKPLDWLSDRLTDYIDGTDLGTKQWSSLTTYNRDSDPVIWTDSKVYQCIKDGALGVNYAPTGTANSLTYWIEVLPNWIGTKERIKYNSQIIILEYALNKIFFNVGVADQIHVETLTTIDGFVMFTTSAGSSEMYTNSLYTGEFMFTEYSPTQNNFTVWVPAALFATLGSTTQDRENSIRKVVDKYRIPGITYNVDTF